MKQIFAITVVLISVVNIGKCLPIVERWKAPCGDQKELVTEIVKHLYDVETLSYNTQTKYGQERIKDATIRDMYMNMHFFDVPTFSEDQQTDAIEDINSWHKQAYRHISKAAVFLEQTAHSETNYANEQNIPGFAEEFGQMNNQTYAILCKIQAALAQKGQFVDNIPSRDIMAENIRNIDNIANIFTRDFIITKDVYLTVKNLLIVYQKVKLSMV